MPLDFTCLQMRAFYPKCEIVMELKDGAHPEVSAEFGENCGHVSGKSFDGLFACCVAQ